MPFIHKNFLLGTPAAVRLYHEYAKDMPIIDYHCHLSPKDIAEDRRFENLTQIWLAGDHYKWRAMRAAGVDERYITGDAGDWEKYGAFLESQWIGHTQAVAMRHYYQVRDNDFRQALEENFESKPPTQKPGNIPSTPSEYELKISPRICQ